MEEQMVFAMLSNKKIFLLHSWTNQPECKPFLYTDYQISAQKISFTSSLETSAHNIMNGSAFRIYIPHFAQ